MSRNYKFHNLEYYFYSSDKGYSIEKGLLEDVIIVR